VFAQNSLYLVLREIGWKHETPGNNVPQPILAPNCAAETIPVRIRKNSTKQARDAAIALQSVLNEVLVQSNSGLSGLSGVMFTEVEANVLEVIVGRHPLYPHPDKPVE